MKMNSTCSLSTSKNALPSASKLDWAEQMSEDEHQQEQTTTSQVVAGKPRRMRVNRSNNHQSSEIVDEKSIRASWHRRLFRCEQTAFRSSQFLELITVSELKLKQEKASEMLRWLAIAKEKVKFSKQMKRTASRIEQTLNRTRADASVALVRLEKAERVAPCHFCGSKYHSAGECTTFLTTEQRIQRGKGVAMCYRCLSPDHKLEDCKWNQKCRKCGRDHHTTLCRN